MADNLDEARHAGREIGSRRRAARGEEGAVVNAQAPFDYLVAEAFQERGGPFQRGLVSGSMGRADGVSEDQAMRSLPGLRVISSR